VDRAVTVRYRRLPPLLLLAGLLSACGPEEGPEARFRADVLPVLERRCAALVCHGVAGDAAERGESLLADAFYFEVTRDGRIADWRAAREAALRFVNTVEGPPFSGLLRKPLPTVYSGLPHGGGDNLTSPRDPAHHAIAAWIAEERAGGEDPDPAGLTPRERHFAERVQPILVGRGCALTNCHGPESFVPFRLDPGLADVAGPPRFSQAMTRANYRESRRFLSLAGVPEQSRLLRKILPLDAGGIVHRGGNRRFVSGPDDRAFAAIVEWADLERVHRVGSASAEVSGIVFVRGPIPPGSPFDIATFRPGGDLYLRQQAGPEGEDVNLTGSLHDGPADIRDPSVSPDGRRLLFSMRASEDDGHQLFEMTLATRAVRQLTDDPPRLPSGEAIANVMPVYGPDGHVYFASNRHGVQAERLDALDVDLFRMPLQGGPVERLTYTPGPELEPTMFRVGHFAAYLVFEHRRAIDARDETVGFSFPVDRHVDYHIFFGITPPWRLFHQFRELPDGRALVVVGEPENAWEGGALARVDRNLGPDFFLGHAVSEPSLPAYAETLQLLDPDAMPSGVSPGGLYRDPVALPDGSVLVAWAPGPIDLTRPGAPSEWPDFGIVHLTLREVEEGCRDLDCPTVIASRETWIDAPGIADYSPEPIVSHPLEADSDGDLDQSLPTLFSMVDITVNDGVMENLEPGGEKVFRQDVHFVRFVEAVPSAPEDWGLVPADEAPGRGSTSGLGVHMPARILGEVALYEDRSLYVSVPPGVPFRTQLLDAERMNVGHQHNRWLFNWPGQHFSQSTQSSLYNARCGGCHGASSGDAEDLLRPLDATTRASITLARFVDQNPRYPRDPEPLGEDTRLEVDFERSIQPLLEAHCNAAGCHGPESPGLVLSGVPTAWYSQSYEALLEEGWGSGGGRRFVDEAGSSARTSYLMEVLLGRELEAPRGLEDHPPLGLSHDEILTVTRWIEVGAPFRLPPGGQP
jgi:hypothetical protein